MSSGVDYEFRTTCLRPLIDEARMERIARAINGARLYALQPFHQTDILHPEFFEGIQAAYGEDDLLRLRAIARPWVQECIVRPAPQISYS
jgi:pyruvate formate lyase activating enzyme